MSGLTSDEWYGVTLLFCSSSLKKAVSTIAVAAQVLIKPRKTVHWWEEDPILFVQTEGKDFPGVISQKLPKAPDAVPKLQRPTLAHYYPKCDLSNRKNW